MALGNSLSFKEKVLNELYIAFSQGEKQVLIQDLCNTLEQTEDELYKVLNELRKEDLASAVTNDSYRILPMGVIFVETNKLASELLISKNRELNTESELRSRANEIRRSLIDHGLDAGAFVEQEDSVEKSSSLSLAKINQLTKR